MEQKIAWHYTTLEKAYLIEADGKIRPAITGVPVNEKPILWFSLAQEWEPTATEGLVDKETGERRDATLTEMVEFAGGLVRYGVYPDARLKLIPWPKIIRKAKMMHRMAESLEKVAVEQGADSSSWLGRLKPLPINRCCRVDIFDAGGAVWREWQHRPTVAKGV